ncbi:hypothetical protein KSP35_05830 [Aquihabitans sp. G128]|uniref:hypothetical protein n=1 Tax=Aquihabitans sp. G128 TaxID=2849779 RepID=UPI001C223920|nr:hypothetical protein [Aquihabitans sp. G128]QXC62324.1 hypothetical protein KSP35_05830 [Aquihabitans sp. G128]
MDHAPASSPLEATVADLVAEVARLRALVDRDRSAPTAAGAATPPTADRAGDGPASAAPEVLDRRAALRRAGMVAAGAVAGGAALAGLAASPAAAATVAGSGSPGVLGTGLGGDGVSGSTDTAAASGVYGTTGTAGAYGVFARHSGSGYALGVEASSSGYAAVAVKALGAGDGIAVTTGEGTAIFTEGGGSGLHVRTEGPAAGVAVEALGGGPGVLVFGSSSGTGTGVAVSNVDTGATLYGSLLGLRVGSGRQHLVLDPPFTLDPPPQRSTPGTKGAIVHDRDDLWLCLASGTPGTWRKLGGANTAGSFHVLPAPARIYDSRSGTLPAVGTKKPLSPNAARSLDLKANASGVPVGATAALLTVLVVNASTGSGNLTVWANGVAKPQANTMVWGGDAGRFTAVSALDAQAFVQVSASLATDVVVDVVGYYR